MSDEISDLKEDATHLVEDRLVPAGERVLLLRLCCRREEWRKKKERREKENERANQASD